jgi:hypothetical protein
VACYRKEPIGIVASATESYTDRTKGILLQLFVRALTFGGVFKRSGAGLPGNLNTGQG